MIALNSIYEAASNPMSQKEVRKPSERLTNLLAEKLRDFRRGKAISQEEMAELCDFHRTYIGSVERGERNVTLSTLEIFAAIMGMTVAELLTEKTALPGPNATKKWTG